MSLKVIILAAGRGKRMYSTLPKVLHPLAGKPILEWVVAAVTPLNPADIYVVYGHEGERVRTQMAHLNVHWVEQVEQLGTGHAVAQVLPRLTPDDDVLVLCGDMPLITSETLQKLLSETSHHSLGIITADFLDPSGLGRIVRDQQGNVTGIVEDADATPEQLKISEINAAILVTSATNLIKWLPQISNTNNQKEYYLPSIVPMAVAEKCPIISVFAACEEEVQGINDRRQLAALECYYQEKVAEQLMLKGVTIMDPARLDVRGELKTAQDITIDINVIFEGKVSIDSGTYIGAHSIIRNSKIGKNVQIHPNSIIDGAEIHDNSIVGPFARIRPGTVLSQGVHVGNFVEVKNTTMGANSKANHLSYLGDAHIGSAVNIGAGTITCNYDGANKHKTVIGDGAFIGSDTQLIAPVTIGAGATVGAGTTIRKDVPENTLAVSRSEQKIVEGWRRPQK